MPLKPTVEEGVARLDVFEPDVGPESLCPDGGCGGAARSALNSLCALPMKPFMMWISTVYPQARKESAGY